MSSPSDSLRGAPASPAGSGADDALRPARVLELAPGQRIQGTVVELSGGGVVTVGAFGTKFTATSRAALEVGRSYEFLVQRVQPKIELVAAVSTAAPSKLPELGALFGLGEEGSGRALAELLKRFTEPGLEPGSVQRASTGAAGSTSTGSEAFATGSGSGVEASARHLAELHRDLGHDQEARVLRAVDHVRRGETVADVDHAAVLRRTRKAEALLWLAADRAAADVESSDSERTRSARSLVEALSGVERDNARRAEQGAPLWLPLPADPERGLDDARMFLFRHGRSDDANEASGRAGTSGAWTIVLLLELSRLGAVRVDLAFDRDRALSIDAEIAEPGALETLRAGSNELVADLERHGLRVERLEFRQAPGQRLTVSDLVRVPDLHEHRPGEALDVQV